MDVVEHLLLLLVFFVGILGGGSVVLYWTYRRARSKGYHAPAAALILLLGVSAGIGVTVALNPQNTTNPALFFLAILLGADAADGGSTGVAGTHPAAPNGPRLWRTQGPLPVPWTRPPFPDIGSHSYDVLRDRFGIRVHHPSATLRAGFGREETKQPRIARMGFFCALHSSTCARAFGRAESGFFFSFPSDESLGFLLSSR